MFTLLRDEILRLLDMFIGDPKYIVMEYLIEEKIVCIMRLEHRGDLSFMVADCLNRLYSPMARIVTVYCPSWYEFEKFEHELIRRTTTRECYEIIMSNVRPEHMTEFEFIFIIQCIIRSNHRWSTSYIDVVQGFEGQSPNLLLELLDELE